MHFSELMYQWKVIIVCILTKKIFYSFTINCHFIIYLKVLNTKDEISNLMAATAARLAEVQISTIKGKKRFVNEYDMVVGDRWAGLFVLETTDYEFDTRLSGLQNVFWKRENIL